jgi:hypothetical protein
LRCANNANHVEKQSDIFRQLYSTRYSALVLALRHIALYSTRYSALVLALRHLALYSTRYRYSALYSTRYSALVLA